MRQRYGVTANAIATSVATRVLAPATAVLMAGVLNVVGALTGTAVASTVGKGIVAPTSATQLLVIANGLPAGTVTVAGGRAALDLNNATGPLPAGVDPVCQIGPIWVTDAGQTTALLVNADFN